ncbi:hypothetical protein T439DRAFT_337474 [Meredithblackwellia eburnea MCA 4105]
MQSRTGPWTPAANHAPDTQTCAASRSWSERSLVSVPLTFHSTLSCFFFFNPSLSLNFRAPMDLIYHGEKYYRERFPWLTSENEMPKIGDRVSNGEWWYDEKWNRCEPPSLRKLTNEQLEIARSFFNGALRRPRGVSFEEYRDKVRKEVEEGSAVPELFEMNQESLVIDRLNGARGGGGKGHYFSHPWMREASMFGHAWKHMWKVDGFSEAVRFPGWEEEASPLTLYPSEAHNHHAVAQVGQTHPSATSIAGEESGPLTIYPRNIEAHSHRAVAQVGQTHPSATSVAGRWLASFEHAGGPATDLARQSYSSHHQIAQAPTQHKRTHPPVASAGSSLAAAPKEGVQVVARGQGSSSRRAALAKARVQKLTQNLKQKLDVLQGIHKKDIQTGDILSNYWRYWYCSEDMQDVDPTLDKNQLAVVIGISINDLVEIHAFSIYYKVFWLQESLPANFEGLGIRHPFPFEPMEISQSLAKIPGDYFGKAVPVYMANSPHGFKKVMERLAKRSNELKQAGESDPDFPFFNWNETMKLWDGGPDANSGPWAGPQASSSQSRERDLNLGAPYHRRGVNDFALRVIAADTQLSTPTARTDAWYRPPVVFNNRDR